MYPSTYFEVEALASNSTSKKPSRKIYFQDCTLACSLDECRFDFLSRSYAKSWIVKAWTVYIHLTIYHKITRKTIALLNSFEVSESIKSK